MPGGAGVAAARLFGAASHRDRPVCTISTMPKGCEHVDQAVDLVCVPVISTISVSGPTSTARARKTSQSCEHSARLSGPTRTLISARSRTTAASRVMSSTRSTLTSL